MKTMSSVFLVTTTFLVAFWFQIDSAFAQETTVLHTSADTTQVVSRPSGPYWIHQQSEADLADLIRYLYSTDLTPAERVEKAAKQSIGTPFRLNAAMYNHHEADCVTLVERVLAIGIADSWEHYIRMVTRLRYAGGMIPFTPGEFSIIEGRLLPHDRTYES